MEVILSIALQIARAVTYLHAQDVIHRDLRLDNILIMDTESNNIQIKLGGNRMLENSLILL
jgi:serine/threonine protein kinase